MPWNAFNQIFQDALLNVKYLCAASVHSIRRQLGKKVDELYTYGKRENTQQAIEESDISSYYPFKFASDCHQGELLYRPC